MRVSRQRDGAYTVQGAVNNVEVRVGGRAPSACLFTRSGLFYAVIACVSRSHLIHRFCPSLWVGACVYICPSAARVRNIRPRFRRFSGVNFHEL